MSNICCRACRSSLQTCLESGACACHWWEAAKDKRGGLPHRDPTAGEAINNISRKRREPKRKRSQR